MFPFWQKKKPPYASEVHADQAAGLPGHFLAPDRNAADKQSA